MELHLRATGCHLPYGITPATRQVNIPRFNPSQRPVHDLPTPEGWKAELT